MAACAAFASLPFCAGAEKPVSVLFLGDANETSAHTPQTKAAILQRLLGPQGVIIHYTNSVQALDPGTLTAFDCLLLNNDHASFSPAQESALASFVAGGGGLIVLHTASTASQAGEVYTSLVGGEFVPESPAEFRPWIIDAQHPIMRGFAGFKELDETGFHRKLSSDNRVLMLRERDGGFEPWAWSREEGRGRVFYCASGHSTEVWNNPAFQNLLERSIRWVTFRLSEELPALPQIPARVPRYIKATAWGTSAESDTMQAPLSPVDSMKLMHTPEGFHVELFASEPDIVKPIAMNWDARGRLWVLESTDYPNNLVADPHMNGNDRIVICEDTDGDGKADKFTVFADHLNIPTGIAFAGKGVIVAVAPYIIYLEATHGDDMADVRKILYKGFGRSDTHAVLSNLHYGLDNWLYGSVGYSGGVIEVGRVPHPIRAGLFRFRPDGSDFEFLTATSNNTWGFGQNEGGDIFASTANNEHAVHLAIPNRYFEAVRGWHGQGSVSVEDHKLIHPVTKDVRQVDVFGGFTAACGFEPYSARAFPEMFWTDTAFVCEPTGHLVHTDKLTRRGSEFIARDAYNLLASSDGWTAPVCAQVGPDGAVWVADWYNYIIQHNPTPQGFANGPGNAYVTPLRDKEHGRIYRVVYGQPSNLIAGAAQLVETLKNDNRFWRLTAQRILVARGSQESAPALADLVRSGANPLAAQHALWTLDGLGLLRDPSPEMTSVIEAALTNSSSIVRRAGLGVLPRSNGSAAVILGHRMLADGDAFVKRDALLALAEIPGNEAAGQALADFLGDVWNTSDRWLTIAAIAAAARNEFTFLRAAARLEPATGSLSPLSEATRVCAEHYARTGPVDSVDQIISAYQKVNVAMAEALIHGLAAGWPPNRAPEITPGLEADLRRLSKRLSLSAQLQVASLAARWGVGERFQADMSEIRKMLLARAEADGESEKDRWEAAEQVMSMASEPRDVEVLLGLITPRTSPDFARGILRAIGLSLLPEVGPLILQRWTSLTPSIRAAAINLLLSRPEWTRSLLAGLETNAVPVGDLGVDEVQRLIHYPDAKVARSAARLVSNGGRLPNPDRQKVVESLLPLAGRHADRLAGKEVFLKNCAVCHRFNSVGANIGPDLTGFAGGNREELLINILDPNRSVEGNFRQFIIETTDGQNWSGLLAGESRTTIELVDVQGARHTFLRDNVKSVTSSGRSLMPEGFERLPAEDIVSLLDFLSPNDRFLPLSLQKVANVKTTSGMFRELDGPERMIFDSWGMKSFMSIPFNLIDPRNNTLPNALVLQGMETPLVRERTSSASIACYHSVRAIHFLSGISGWGFPTLPRGTVSMIVRLHFESGITEDHALTNGIHFADYNRRIDVPGSLFAFELRGGYQVRYFSIEPASHDSIQTIEFVKGPDRTAPVVLAVTIEPSDKASKSDSSPPTTTR